MEEVIAECRSVKYHWNFLRSFIHLFFLGYFLILWIATYNFILYMIDDIPYDYWLIFFSIIALFSFMLALTIFAIVRLPMRYYVKKEGYSFMPRKYAITETGIYYYFRGAGYRCTSWSDITRIRFMFGSRVVRIYTNNKMDLGLKLNTIRRIQSPGQKDIFDILLRPKDVTLFMEMYKVHVLN